MAIHSLSPAPKVDVVLHCGDLTKVGDLLSPQHAVEDIKTFDPELKLVIAGNHDLELDYSWVHKNMEDSDDLRKAFNARPLCKHRSCMQYTT
jgi:predicted phosphodiesterase